MYNFKGEKLGCTKTRYGWICEIGAVQKVCMEQIYAKKNWEIKMDIFDFKIKRCIVGCTYIMLYAGIGKKWTQSKVFT